MGANVSTRELRQLLSSWLLDAETAEVSGSEWTERTLRRCAHELSAIIETAELDPARGGTLESH